MADKIDAPKAMESAKASDGCSVMNAFAGQSFEDQVKAFKQMQSMNGKNSGLHLDVKIQYPKEREWSAGREFWGLASPIEFPLVYTELSVSKDKGGKTPGQDVLFTETIYPFKGTKDYTCHTEPSGTATEKSDKKSETFANISGIEK